MRKKIDVPAEVHYYDRPEWCPHRDLGMDGHYHCKFTPLGAESCDGDDFPDDCPLEDDK